MALGTLPAATMRGLGLDNVGTKIEMADWLT
jgi:hypothetical protein